MKKIVEVEYVGIEDIQEIVESAYAVMREGHYVNVQISQGVFDVAVSVMIMLDGFDSNGKYDYDYRFYMTDTERDVNSMYECKSTLNNLLCEEE